MYKSFYIAGIVALLSCSEKKGTDSTKFRQYFNKGQELYLTHCSNCHQKDGTGLGLVYPPLAVSDYMDSNFKEVVCLIRNGKKGELLVNGKRFNMEMPAIPSLTDLEIAEISTFIYNSWSHERGLVDVKDVTRTLQNCSEGK